MKTPLVALTILSVVITIASAHAEPLLGEEPALGSPESRMTQAEIDSGQLSLHAIRRAGLKIFATPFNQFDGFGDGPVDPIDRVSPGGRPMLQNNGTFLRVNGLDAQSCLDCHSIVSAATVPFTGGVGGAGGLNNSAVFQARFIDVEDVAGSGFAAMDGRLINPPALFGTGGVQLVAKEMTRRLQRLKAYALAHPGEEITLRTKGVDFGSIMADTSGQIDTSKLEGIDDDLIVRPFGRKGEFSSVRAFDLGALMFHLGMEPVEVVGENVDGDGDGVVNEVLAGEVSALEIFITTQERPQQSPLNRDARRGLRRFQEIGCAGCHRRSLTTRSSTLEYSFPESETDPGANVFFSVDLSRGPMRFERTRGGGIRVPMFSDLKRHDMGPELAESFHAATEQQNREFITAKLWGVADTAPYLHDGRALTLNEAIVLHGGEAREVRDVYLALPDTQKNQILEFLNSLRNPRNPNTDVLN